MTDSASISPNLSQADLVENTAQSATTHEDRRDARILVTVLFALAAWGGAIAMFGVPGLYLPALALVPVVYVLLIAISRG